MRLSNDMGRLGGGVQPNAMVDRMVHGTVRIDLGEVNVRKLLAEKKWRYPIAEQVVLIAPFLLHRSTLHCYGAPWQTAT